MSEITKKDLSDLESRLSAKIDGQGDQLRKEMKEQGAQLRKEIRESADSVLEVIAQMAETTHKQSTEIRDELADLRFDLGMVKRELNQLCVKLAA